MRIFFILVIALIFVSCTNDIDETQCYDVTTIYYCSTDNKIINPETLKGTCIDFSLNEANQNGGIRIYTIPENFKYEGFSNYYKIDEVLEKDSTIMCFGIDTVQKKNGIQERQLDYVIMIAPNGTVVINTFGNILNGDCSIIYKIKTPVNIKIDPKFPRFSRARLKGMKNFTKSKESTKIEKSNKSDTKTFLVKSSESFKNEGYYPEKAPKSMKYVFSKKTITLIGTEPSFKIIYEILGDTVDEDMTIYTVRANYINSPLIFIILFNDHKQLYVKPNDKERWFLHNIKEIESQDNTHKDNNNSPEQSKKLNKEDFEELMEEYKKDNDWGE
jgi:hypothetical protein